MRGGTSKMSATPFEQYDPVNYRLDQLSFSAYLNEEAEDNQWQRQALRQALGRAIREELTGRQREVLLLYYLDQLTMQQVAERLDVNRSTVCRTLQRGEARLRRCLRYGGERLLRRSESQGDGLGLPTDKRRRGNPCRAPRRHPAGGPRPAPPRRRPCRVEAIAARRTTMRERARERPACPESLRARCNRGGPQRREEAQRGCLR